MASAANMRRTTWGGEGPPRGGPISYVNAKSHNGVIKRLHFQFYFRAISYSIYCRLHLNTRNSGEIRTQYLFMSSNLSNSSFQDYRLDSPSPQLTHRQGIILLRLMSEQGRAESFSTHRSALQGKMRFPAKAEQTTTSSEEAELRASAAQDCWTLCCCIFTVILTH